MSVDAKDKIACDRLGKNATLLRREFVKKKSDEHTNNAFVQSLVDMSRLRGNIRDKLLHRKR